MHRFADAHDYAIRVVERDCGRRGGWIKIEPLLALLEDGFDYVLWLDADTVVARTDIDIRNVTHGSVDLHMTWHNPAPRPNGDPPHFNTGVMLIRASNWSRAFFTQVWEVGPLEHRWNDQATIHHALGFHEVLDMGRNREDVSKHPIARLNLTWNSIPNVCTLADPVIWHYAGMEMGARIDAMRSASRPRAQVGGR